MSFDINFKHFRKRNWSQSLWSRAMSFDAYAMRAELSAIQSQSLWNRAMSFDTHIKDCSLVVYCLNPFGTGQCLSTKKVSPELSNLYCLNPFGTGQCLSTVKTSAKKIMMVCLNPFGTG